VRRDEQSVITTNAVKELSETAQCREIHNLLKDSRPQLSTSLQFTQRKSTPVAPYQNDDLEEARLDVLHDLGSAVPQVTLQTFMDFLAPPRPDFDIEATINELRSMPGGILSASGRWEAYNEEPKDQSGGEGAVFNPLTEIFNKIVAAVIASSNSKLTALDRSVEFAQNPSRAPTSADRYNATRPDRYLLVKDRLDRETTSWADIVLSCEYKREDGMDQLDDVSILREL
jgi:hypothetical protein